MRPAAVALAALAVLPATAQAEVPARLVVVDPAANTSRTLLADPAEFVQFETPRVVGDRVRLLRVSLVNATDVVGVPLAGGRPRRILRLRYAGEAALDPAGRRVAIATGDRIVIRAVSGRRLRSLRLPARYVDGLAWSGDGARLAVSRAVGKRHVVDVFDIATLDVLAHFRGGTVADGAFSPDGRRVLQTDGDRARTFDIASGRRRTVRHSVYGFTQLGFTPGGRPRVLTADSLRTRFAYPPDGPAVYARGRTIAGVRVPRGFVTTLQFAGDRLLATTNDTEDL